MSYRLKAGKLKLLLVNLQKCSEDAKIDLLEDRVLAAEIADLKASGLEVKQLFQVVDAANLEIGERECAVCIEEYGSSEDGGEGLCRLPWGRVLAGTVRVRV